MTCRGVLDALSDYIEGDAGRSVCKKIEEHLEGCVKCRIHVDAMKKMVILYKKWRNEPIPEDVRMRLEDVIVRECLIKGVDPQGRSRPGSVSAASDRDRRRKTPGTRGKRGRVAKKRPKTPRKSPPKR